MVSIRLEVCLAATSSPVNEVREPSSLRNGLIVERGNLYYPGKQVQLNQVKYDYLCSVYQELDCEQRVIGEVYSNLWIGDVFEDFFEDAKDEVPTF